MTVLQALISYIQFSDGDVALLAKMGPILTPFFPRIVDRFYDAIHRTPEALAVFEGGEAQIQRQKGMLQRWLVGLFGGVYDDAYYEERAKIGRTHVRINLDQRFMFAAMNVVRRELHAALGECGWPESERYRGHTAIDKICDIELAVMLETYREASVQRVQQTERLATVGQIAASIGHELRNPLAVMQTSIQLLGRRVSDDPRAEKHLRRIGDQIGLCNAIISDLLELARDRPPERHPVDLIALVRQTVIDVPRPAAVQVELDMPEDVAAIHADAGQVRQVIVNLVLNAVQAIGPEGRIDVRVVPGDEFIELVVDDSGPGLPADVLRRLFEPLFTTRSSGTGLGLALCRRITEKHGGSINAANREEGGARFTVALPRTEESV
ncbi:MAG: histidine kinase [Myxococcales bacterium]|nr:histidine kinase [Myxococcales bacterium]MCB9704301.1 histidine kinase [Myxococcales bacterium]